MGEGDKSNVRNYIEGLFKSKGDGGLNLSAEDIKSISKMEDGEKILEILDKKKKGAFGNLSLGQIASLYGLGTAALGFLIDKTTDDEDIGTLDHGWNWLVGWYNEKRDGQAKIIHYTEGGPWFEETRNCEYDHIWKQELINLYTS